MPSSDDAPPPTYFGDYPLGAYWAAERDTPGDEEEPADHAVSGPVIRLMWDYGVRVPLWDAEGLLPEDPEWLREALGLGDPLIEDLRKWGLDMEALDASPSRRTTEAHEALHARARQLVRRLQEDVGSRYRIVHHPW